MSGQQQHNEERHWIREEFERARARNAQIPPWARPVITRPPSAGVLPSGADHD